MVDASLRQYHGRNATVRTRRKRHLQLIERMAVADCYF